MNTEDRLRRVLQSRGGGNDSGHPDPGSLESIRSRIARRRRRIPALARRLWFVIPVVVVAAVSIPVVEALAPAGRSTQVEVKPGPSAGATQTLAVKACPAATGSGPRVATPAKVTVPDTGSTALAAYGYGVVAVGPSGWDCRAFQAADGTDAVVVYPPGETLPPNGVSHATETVNAITAMLAPAGDASAQLTCGQVYAATVAPPLSSACSHQRSAADNPLPSPYAWESRFENLPGRAGSGLYSGGTNPTLSTEFYLPTSETGGTLSCTLAASAATRCGAAIDSFSAEYVRLEPVPGLPTQTPTERAVEIYSAVLSRLNVPENTNGTHYVTYIQASEAGADQPLFVTSTANASGFGASTSLPPMPEAVQQGLAAALPKLDLQFTTDPNSLFVTDRGVESGPCSATHLPANVTLVSLGQIPAGNSVVAVRGALLISVGGSDGTFSVVRTRSGWIVVSPLLSKTLC